jgi:hypothetical protein
MRDISNEPRFQPTLLGHNKLLRSDSLNEGSENSTREFLNTLAAFMTAAFEGA